MTYGLDWGEGLIGTLPAGWHYVRRSYPNGSWQPSFQQQPSGTVTLLNPRIDWEELRLESPDEHSPGCFEAEDDKGHFRYPDEEYLLRHNVQLLALRLV